MTWQGVSEAECYDNRSVMAQIMRLKDRVRALEEEGTEEIEHEIELINEELTILEGKVAGLEEGTAGLAEDVAALESGKADANNVVRLTGAQTIWGIKDFDSSPIVPTPRNDFEAATKKYVDDNAPGYTAGLGLSISNDVIGIEQNYADNLVKKTGNQQVINSSILFNTIPRAPGTPTDAAEVANKHYVDTVAGGGGGGGTYYAGTGLSLANNTFSLDTATQTTLGQVANKADDSAVVKLTGAQTVQGVKTFDSPPIVPTPTTDYEVATKKYVDDNAGGSGSGPWTAVASNEWTTTKFAELFQEEGGTSYAVYSALKDVMIAIMYAENMAWSTYIPKGGIVPKYLHFMTMQGTTSSGANYASMVRLELKRIFTNTSDSNVVGNNYPLNGITNSTTTLTNIKSRALDITYGNIKHQSVIGTYIANSYNLFIKYR